MRVADYIAETLAAYGVRHVFLVTGGGAMHLNDAIGRCAELEYICCHHEQACAMAAESYYRVANRLAAVNVTTGPGGINALNGVFGAYTDSIPMIVVSGQVKRETCMGYYEGLDIRQLGDQEANIVDMAKSVTKYIALVREPEEIRYQLEKAIYLATHGRFGPTWLDVPVDVQGAQIEPDELPGFDPSQDSDVQREETAILRGEALSQSVEDVLARLEKAERPVILAGHGARLSGAHEELLQFAERLKIPVVAAWNAADVVPTDHECYAGRPGTVGERAGNFATQNADVVLVVGCRLNIRQVSYAWGHFARAAFKIQIDIDTRELDKPTVKPDLGICADAREWVQEALRQTGASTPRTHEDYLDWCRERVRRFSVVSDEQRHREELVSGYHFVEVLTREMADDDIVITANGAASVMLMQAASVKKAQRLIGNSGSASMGFDLPAAIGASIARSRGQVICLAGDGSIMMNLQELQTVAHYNLPIKIFVWSNGMYLSIRTTQQSFFNGNLVGEGETSGVSSPNFLRLAEAFGIRALSVDKSTLLEETIREVLAAPGPVLCDVKMPSDELMLPKTSSLRLPDGRMVSKPLEDMFPFLPRDEFAQNMLIEPLVE
jgi:acetolactate synthase-1/2/3 large subunit